MGLDVTGGVGGVGAALEDLSAAAWRLAEVAAETGAVALAVLRAAASPDLLEAAVVHPVLCARLAAGLADLAGPRGLGGEALALRALAAEVRSAVAAYAGAEQAVAVLVEGAQDAAVFVLARQALPLAAGGVVLQRLGVDVPAAADRVAFAAPWLVDLAGGAEGALAGPVTPLDYEQAVGLLGRAGATRGWLTEAGRAVRVRPLTPSGAARAPSGAADLVAGQRDLEGPGAGPGRVRVVQVPQADGSSTWVVVVPGTQVWSPRAGPNPSDLTSDLLLMAHTPALLAAGVEKALAEAQAAAGRSGAGDPVLLAGHSQGGIAAAALAADPGFRRRQRVTHVVTSGAPVARMPVPAAVSVLSLEHRQDAVPRLEGALNPDRRGWLTVVRDLGTEAGTVRRASAAHGVAPYQATARLVEGSRSASLAEWRRGSAAFFAGPAHGPAHGQAHGSPTVRDYRVERVGPAP